MQDQSCLSVRPQGALLCIDNSEFSEQMSLVVVACPEAEYYHLIIADQLVVCICLEFRTLSITVSLGLLPDLDYCLLFSAACRFVRDMKLQLH